MSDKNKESGTHVNLKLDPVENEVLTRSAKLNNRTKREEAAIRLKHHLATFRGEWVISQEVNK